MWKVYSRGLNVFLVHNHLEFVNAKRGARAIVNEGHKYVLNWRGQDGTYLLEVWERYSSNHWFQELLLSFSQALMIKYQNIGLEVAYGEDANVNRSLRRTAALTFVPVRFVWLAWQAGCCPTIIALSRDRKMQELKEHFDTNKIKLEECVHKKSAHTDV